MSVPPYTRSIQNVAQTTYRPDTITPYLGFKSRMSQIWLNRWTILILLILARLLISTGSIDSQMASAERQALSACRGVETTGSAVASMPHYMAGGINEMTAMGLEKAVVALMNMLDMIIHGVEEIVVWYINMITGMYMCLITFAVDGSIHAATAIIEDATEFLNKTITKIGGEVGDLVGKGGDALNDASSAVEGFFTGGKYKDGFNIDTSKLEDKLDAIKLPSDLLDPLKKINDSLPTFKDVQNFTDNAIKTPFEEVRKLIKKELPTFKFNGSMFPVPEKESLSFCSDNNGISNFFEHLTKIIKTAKIIFIVVLIVAAFLACIPMAYRELRTWRLMRRQAEIVHASQAKQDPLDVVYQVSRPHTARAGVKLAGWLGEHDKRGTLTRWFIAYITSTPALFVLCLGIAGLLTCLCQFILLQAIKKVVPELTGEVADFSEKVVHSVQNASVSWSNGTNAVINHTNDDINDKVFGWVNTTTHGINHTLNVFMDESTKTLHKAFGGTILEDPIKTVFDCIVGMKVEAVEKGLTWVSDHAHVDFPNVPNDTFSLALEKGSHHSNDMTEFLADPSDKTSDAVSGAVIKVVNAFEKALVTETCISAAVCGIWLIVVLMALVRACMLSGRRAIPHGEGGEDNGPQPPEQGEFKEIPLNDENKSFTPQQSTRSLNRVPSYSRRLGSGEQIVASSPLPDGRFPGDDYMGSLEDWRSEKHHTFTRTDFDSYRCRQ
ncbi:plasma membrane fusion protein prm1 [Ascosphaera pollenicola]|nr:plasma membrane fusion protein prm1 [Ascosphaera pollenicola]